MSSFFSQWERYRVLGTKMPPYSRINFRNGRHTCTPADSKSQTCRFPVLFFMPLLLGLITDQKYFSIIVLVMPRSKGVENETGKRHVWLSDSAGAHVCMPFLKLMRDHGGIFVPRTLYLSHREQNKDIVNFREFKRMESRKRQAIQTVLITSDWLTLARQRHGELTLGIHHMQQCMSRP